jgi:hypothetical protein
MFDSSALRAAAALLVTSTFVSACDSATGGGSPLNEYGNPMTVPMSATEGDISVADLQSRLYAFAHDSMQGRMRGRDGNRKGTDYIAHELERLGIEPGGENGTYFQHLPFVERKFTEASTLSVDGTQLVWLQEWLPVPGAVAPRPFPSAQVVYGGIVGDTARQISSAQAAGKLVVLTRPPDGAAAGAAGGRGGGGGGGGGGGRGGGAAPRFAQAAAIATVDLQTIGETARRLINNPAGVFVNPNAQNAQAPEPGPANLRITPEAAAKLFGGRVPDGLELGTAGGTVTASLAFVSTPTPDYSRNVVGIIRGSDPTLSAEFVSLGAHPDHVGYNGTPIDHDSARVRQKMVQARSIQDTALVPLDAAATATVVVNVDSLHRVRPARLDSISNGADDDGSGSMALLEIAEAFATAPQKPRRSLIFIWNNSEEGGLSGSQWFVNNPAVPLESIVANLNMDMIGRGRPEDVPGGSDDLVFVIGSYNDSQELGEIVSAVNGRAERPLTLDYRLDPPTEWPGYNNLYGRSDHINFARRGIPIAFFFTGLHYDYHRVTDEPQYIHYPKLQRIATLVHDIALEVANRDQRPVMNPNPAGGTPPARAGGAAPGRAGGTPPGR